MGLIPEFIMNKTALVLLAILLSVQTAGAQVKLVTFDVDATPPLGSSMAYDPVRRLDELTLRCRGIVLLGAEQPIGPILLQDAEIVPHAG